MDINSDTIPEKIGKYSISKEIGHGNMAVVYLGYDAVIKREVAIKVAFSKLLSDKQEGEKFKKMFFNEARIVGILNHPNIIPVYDAGIEDQYCYLVMEYIKKSNTLKKFCYKNNLLEIEKAVVLVYKCAKALSYAHSMGVIHKDIKPGNIMLTEKMDVKIGDFGIAVLEKKEDTYYTGVMGSPRYMSPEQIGNENITFKTDIYSLGVLMYELLTGEALFTANSVKDMINKVLNETPKPPLAHNPALPEALNNIVMKAVQRDLSKRYDSMNELSTDLFRFILSLKHTNDGSRNNDKFLALKKHYFFTDFTDKEIWEVLNASTWYEYSSGKEIVKEGEYDDSFYVIIKGSVTVKKKGKVVDRLKESSYFGELSYITGSKRMATIVADSDAILLNVSSSLLSKSSPSCQLRFNKIFLKTLVERLSKTPDRLYFY
ncbi:serine/threonine protein kinase with PASTA sensor(s) [Candidatus Magnetoovum chiemensis]|nr:serine/threonine protein kinase with PASTA sensor(s) [Candidatus Magnetoovum chiemensis]